MRVLLLWLHTFECSFAAAHLPMESASPKIIGNSRKVYIESHGKSDSAEYLPGILYIAVLYLPQRYPCQQVFWLYDTPTIQ
jgi:hypothetical protein